MKLETPLKESAPRVPPPHGDHIFYYPQIDTLSKLSQGKNWNFADIRPDAVVFSPYQSALQRKLSDTNTYVDWFCPK